MAREKTKQNQEDAKEAIKSPHLIFKLIKRVATALSKNPKKWLTHRTPAITEADSIATSFENISSDPDLDLSAEEKTKYKSLMKAVKSSIHIIPITNRELERALKKANPRSAGGLDGIPNTLLTNICSNARSRDALRTAINNMLYLGSELRVAESLKLAKLIAIPKAKPGEFRPISLLPNLAKLIESIIEHRIRQEIEHVHPTNQHGCRPGHGTNHPILRLLHEAGQAAQQEKQFAFATFDFSEAFDRVQHYRLIKKMHTLKI
jgi:hypothetical protein